MNPVIDQTALDALLESIGGDKTFLVEIIDTYLDDSPKQIAAMRQAVQVNRVDNLRRAAHSLKSTSKNLGTAELASQCMELENLARDNQVTDATERIDKIETAYAQAQQALLEIRANL